MKAAKSTTIADGHGHQQLDEREARLVARADHEHAD
jgi:hypothetical protein